MRYKNFRAAYTDITHLFKRDARVVPPNTWQGVDVSKKPEMATRELEDLFFGFPIETEDLAYHRTMIGPNLPWADDHFEKDRVSGEPLNPGLTWKQWPYALKADGFRTIKRTELPERDWAYLAAMIDGDGCITLHQRNSSESTVRPRIQISQKDHSFIKYLGKRYPFGQVSFTRERTIELNNHTYETNPGVWQVTRKEDVRWALQNLLPYLVLKQQKAMDALEVLEGRPEHHSEKEARSLLSDPLFNHSYAERYWPKHAGGSTDVRRGIRYNYGDLNDVVNLLVKNPGTRNAYLPVWSFEDTGVVHGGRTPCTIGYLFRMRENRLSVFYDIRSCDFVRHFKDDVYLTIRLLLWVLQQLRTRDPRWDQVKPGTFQMHIGSFHIFENDWRGAIG
jgi:hypothetical protein